MIAGVTPQGAIIIPMGLWTCRHVIEMSADCLQKRLAVSLKGIWCFKVPLTMGVKLSSRQSMIEPEAGHPGSSSP